MVLLHDDFVELLFYRNTIVPYITVNSVAFTYENLNAIAVDAFCIGGKKTTLFNDYMNAGAALYGFNGNADCKKRQCSK